MNYLERKAYSLFDMIIVPTHGVKNALNQRGFKGHFGFFPTCLNLQNLPNPSTQELEAFQQKFDLSNKKLILFVGRMSPEKGVNQILRLVPSIVKEEPNAHFLMVGTGPFLEKYKKISQQCNLTRYITFTGYLSDFDLFSAISISNLGLIFANDAQIFDMTILEYWHYGLPLVIRKAMGIDEVVTDGKNGLLFSSLDEGKNNILTLLKDEDLSVKIKRNCKSNVDKNYDIKKCIPKLENLYGWCSNLYYHT